jgi:hypothetical protein
MTCDTKSIWLLRMLFYLMEGYPQTLENCIHFLQSAFYNYCNELISLGFDVRKKEGDAKEGNIRSIQRNQNHDNQRLLNHLIFKPDRFSKPVRFTNQ